jgi:DNA polymerase-3 subunit alpha
LKKEKEVIGFYISGHPLDDFKFEIKQFCNCRIDELQNISELKGRDVSFAGIITDVSHRISKTGKPFGSFVIEDFYGSTSITLFGEDYGKLKAYLEPESLVYVKAKVQNKFHSPDDWELKPYNIQFLKDAADKLTKQVTVKLRLHDVNKDLISKLGELLTSHKGSTPVRMYVVDVERNWSIPFTSSQHKITVQAKLLDEIKAVTNGEVSLA